eukprot:gene10631-11782_t
MEEVEIKALEEGLQQMVMNPTYGYFQTQEKLHGFLSQQFPTIANPAPLGFCAFALTTFVLSMYNTGAIIDLRANHGGVLGLALFYGGLAQFCAGMWEFKTGNTLGATLFTSYGAFWMSYAALFIKAFGFLDGYAGGNPADLRNALGIYLLAWAWFTLMMAAAVHRTTVGLVSLLFILFCTFLMLAIGEFSDDIYCTRAGGILGIIDACIAWYCALAAILTKKNSFCTLSVVELDPIYKKLGWLEDDDMDCKI